MIIEDKVHIDVSRNDLETILIDHFRNIYGVRIKECSFNLGTEARGEYDVQVLKNFTATGERINKYE